MRFKVLPPFRGEADLEPGFIASLLTRPETLALVAPAPSRLNGLTRGLTMSDVKL